MDQIVKGTASHVRHVGIPERNQRSVGMPVDNTDGMRRVFLAVFHYLLIWTHDIHPLVKAMCILVCIFLPCYNRLRKKVIFMRLDLSCIRDILLCVEEHTDLNNSCLFIDENTGSDVDSFLGHSSPTLPDYQIDLQKKYSNDKLIYHVRYCVEDGLIYRITSASEPHYRITDLTPSGHSIIRNIRPKSVWEIILPALSEGCDASISAVADISKELMISFVKSKLGLS